MHKFHAAKEAVHRCRDHRTVAVAAAVLTLAVVLGSIAPSAQAAVTRSGMPIGPEGIPLESGKVLASASTSARGATIDGIACDASEQVIYHVHTHLSIYINGHMRAIPPGIGLVEPVAQQTVVGPFDSATTCYYWLHVHAGDGVIHIESPTARKYTLGQFFDIWRQPLTTSQVGPARGKVTTFVNGRIFTGNPRTITLGSHVDIQIDVGTPVVGFETVNWSKSNL